MPISVVVVILSWNRKNAVMGCIERVKTLSCADIRIAVVDNGSTDGSPDAIRAAHPDVTLLEESVNSGFAGGVNRGLAEAATREADYAWLLNDDTYFESTTLAALLDQAAAHTECGLLTPLIRDLDDNAGEQFTNGLVDWHRCAMFHNLRSDAYARLCEAGATPIVPGTAMLCDMRVYAAIGGFDPRFFAYWEDVDYAIRAARAGFASRVIEKTPIRHAATRSRNDRPPHYCYYMVRNEALFWRLHHRGGSSLRWKRRWLVDTLTWIAESRDSGTSANADACIDGLWDAVLHRYGPRSDHRPAPTWLRKVLRSLPYVLANLVAGNFAHAMKRLARGV